MQTNFAHSFISTVKTYLFCKPLVLLIVFVVGIGQLVQAKERVKIQVLMFSGANNHNWKETTPALKKILESDGLFQVEVTNTPSAITEEMLSKFDVIVSNWNLFPEKNGNWDQKTKKVLTDFIQDGKGFVFVHAASSTHYDWVEYQKIAGATWGKGTHHGRKKPFEVRVENIAHPITEGMANFWTNDELWIDLQEFQTTQTLASGFGVKSNRGNEEWEPVLMTRSYGDGRSVFLVLGHDVQSMKNIGFRALLKRGTEWASKGKVTQALPIALRKNSSTTEKEIAFQKNRSSLSCSLGDNLLWKYNFEKNEGKPYFHPLHTTQGTNLTCLRPEDHPWHRALWFSWKYINGVNYWEEDRKTGISDGKTVLVDTRVKASKRKGANVTLRLEYKPSESKESVLSEVRSIHVGLPQEDGSYTIDWESTFTALADTVVLDRTPIVGESRGKKWGGYAGFSVRMDQSLWDVRTIAHDETKKPFHGSKGPFLTYQARNIQGKEASLTILDHPQNLRAENTWYVENSTTFPFYYFSPAPLFESSYSINKGESFTLRYRVLIRDGEYQADSIQKDWKQFADL